jgi:hypothetical protein
MEGGSEGADQSGGVGRPGGVYPFDSSPFGFAQGAGLLAERSRSPGDWGASCSLRFRSLRLRSGDGPAGLRERVRLNDRSRWHQVFKRRQ